MARCGHRNFDVRPQAPQFLNQRRQFVDGGDLLLTTTNTDGTGRYLFSGLIATNYVVVVDKARPDADRLLPQLRAAEAEGCYLFSTQHRGDELTAYARFFNPTVGLWEDSATGTAAGPLAAFLSVHELVEQGQPIVIEQGRFMGRPSILTIDFQNGVELSGSGVIVMKGSLIL